MRGEDAAAKAFPAAICINEHWLAYMPSWIRDATYESRYL